MIEDKILNSMKPIRPGVEGRSLVREYAGLLLGHVLLAEGSEIPEPAEFNRMVVDLMLKTL